MQAERQTRFAASRDITVNEKEGAEACLRNVDQHFGDTSNKLSASKRAKTEHNFDTQAQDGLLTQLFESPFGLIRRMWTGVSQDKDSHGLKSQTQEGGLKKVANQNNQHDKSPCEDRFGNKSFRSAETMASSTDRKSNEPRHMIASTKQFKADLSVSSAKKRSRTICARSPPVRKIWPTSTFSLERQPSGVPVEFDLYEEIDLPFLDKSTEVGRMVSKNIIQQALDDDVMTDDEMIMAANKLLSREVEKSIKQFNSGFDKSYIRNLKL